MTRPRVAILGGGAGALTTAYYLTRDEEWRQRFESVTVYQQGWRLGGKGASGRGPNDRIEEHGLHIWLGFYDNAFRMLGECYERQGLRMADGFEPASTFVLYEKRPEGWLPWVAQFPTDERVPWRQDNPSPPPLWSLLVRCLELAVAQARALRRVSAPLPGARPAIRFVPADPPHPTLRIVPSAVPVVHPWVALRNVAGDMRELLGRIAGTSAYTAATALESGMLFVHNAARQLAPDPAHHSEGDHAWLATVADAAADTARTQFNRLVDHSDQVRRQWYLIDLLLANVRGVLADGLLWHGVDAVDHIDYAEWLLRHGAQEESVRCALVTSVVYDMAFAYRDGRPDQPACSAASALRGLARLFFDYKGAIAWKMRAGMGDVVFAPLYSELRDRGVTFEFFHRVDRLRLSPDLSHVAAVELTRQVDLRPGVKAYDPLIQVHGRMCWPAAPLHDQLRDLTGITASDLENLSARIPGSSTVNLEFGRNDIVVLGIGVGALRWICADLVTASVAWRDLVDNVATVATQAFQLWLADDTAQLGDIWPGATTGGFTEPFDTYADMSHLISAESWDGRVASIAYFCNVLPAPAYDFASRDLQRVADDTVRRNVVRFLENDLPMLLPGGGHRYPSGFRWDLLVGESEAAGPERIASQYWRANVQPSDRYVLSLPGSARYRLAPGGSGFANLYLAGDWTECGLNSGCVEAAVTSGMLAAHAIAPDTIGLAQITGLEHLRGDNGGPPDVPGG